MFTISHTSLFKKVHILFTEQGMILEKDVINIHGSIILPKHTILTDTLIQKLLFHNIDFVYVRDSDNFYPTTDHSLTILFREKIYNKLDSSVIQNIQKSYSTSALAVQQALTDIEDGYAANLNSLFETVAATLNHVPRKSDLLIILHNLKLHDHYTYTHCLNVGLLCYLFGEWLGFKEENVKDLTLSGLLHDLGKAKVNVNIINKPSSLTDNEFSEMKNHSLYGYEMLLNQQTHSSIKCAVLQHHEKIDGSGYPYGLTNNDIHDFAKIVAIADIFDAMTACRSYRNKLSPFTVIEHMQNECLGKLDTKYLITFLQHIAYYFIGEKVRLSDNRIGEIILINKDCLSRPLICIQEEMLDLLFYPNLTIEEVL